MCDESERELDWVSEKREVAVLGKNPDARQQYRYNKRDLHEDKVHFSVSGVGIMTNRS